MSRSRSEETYQTIKQADDAQSPICLQRGGNIDVYVSAKYQKANLIRKKTSRLVFEGLNSGECKIAVVSKSNYETFRRNNEVNPNWYVVRELPSSSENNSPRLPFFASLVCCFLMKLFHLLFHLLQFLVVVRYVLEAWHHFAPLHFFCYYSISTQFFLFIHRSGRIEQYVPSGLATTVDTGDYCTSLIDHVLDYHIMDLKFDGYFDRVIGDHFKETGDPRCVNKEKLDLLEEEEKEDSLYGLGDDTTSLSMYEMSGIFIVHAGFCALALLLAMFKFYRARKDKVHSSLRSLVEIGSLTRPKKSESSGTALGGATVIASDGETPRSVYHCSGLEPVAKGSDHQRSSETIGNNQYAVVERNKDDVSFFPLMRDQSFIERRLSV